MSFVLAARTLVIPAVKKRPKYGLKNLPAPLHRRIARFASAAASPAFPDYTPNVLCGNLSGGLRLAAEQVGVADLPLHLSALFNSLSTSTEKLLSEALPQRQVPEQTQQIAEDANLEHSVSASFRGTWVLDRDRSDPPGPQLKALGVKWFMRQAAALAQPRVTISLSQEAGTDVWCEHIDVGHLFQQKDSLRLDAMEQAKQKHGFSIRECSRVEDDGSCVATRIDYHGGQRTEIRRYVIEAKGDQPAAYMVENNLHMPDHTVIRRTSYFSQV